MSKRPDFYIEEDINESNSKLSFDEEIKYELKRYLEGTIWKKVGQIDERAEKLIDLHRKFIDIVRDKLSADEIAKKLFKYEQDILNRK